VTVGSVPFSERLRRTIVFLQRQNHLDFFPLGQTLRHYTAGQARADFRAAINVALMAFPQGMAYALIAGLPIKYGIYCSALACLIGPIFSSSRLAILGPTNATSVLIMSTFLSYNSDHPKLMALSLLVLMVGLFLIVAAYLKIAQLTQYVSRSVVVGYISGAALLIMAHQLQNLLGFHVYNATTFYDLCVKTVKSLDRVSLPAVFISSTTFAVWWLLQKRCPRLPVVAVTLVVMMLVTQTALVASGDRWFIDFLEPLPLGYWPLTPPPLNLGLFHQLASAAMAITLFAILESTFITKTLAGRTGQPINVNQDVLSLGMANIACALGCGMTASTSPVRSTLNWTSGAATPLSSVMSGAICGGGVVLLGPIIGYIPLPALAVVVMGTAAHLIDWHHITVSLKATRSDATVLAVTFLATLLTPLDFAIFLGVATSIVLYLRKASSPQLVEYTFNEEGNLAEVTETVQRPNAHISIIHVEGELFFGAAELFLEQIRRLCNDTNVKVVILRLKNARHLDATSVLAMEELVRHLRSSDRHLLVSGATKDVYRVMKNSGVLEVLGKENFFLASVSNPNYSTREALKRAQQLLGKEETGIRIYYDPNKKG
jgi:SulP family sulfate permease